MATGTGYAATGYSQQLADSAPKAIEKPRLAHQIDVLDKVLALCHDVACNLEGAADRILGSVPQDASKETAKPPASTIEQRLQEAISRAEYLANRLGNASQRLNQAV